MKPTPRGCGTFLLPVLFLTAVVFPDVGRAQSIDDNNLPIPGRLSDLPGPAILRMLAQRRVEVAAGEMEDRYKEFLAGRGSDAVFIDACCRWREAFCGLSPDPYVALLAWENHLRRMLKCEGIEEARLKAGRVLYNPFRSAVDDAGAGLARILFTEVSPDPKGSAISLELKNAADLSGPMAMRALARNRYETAVSDFAARWEEFLAGRNWNRQLFVIQSSLRLMEAQTGMSGRAKDRIDALEGHLQRMLLAFHFEKTCYDTGRVPLSDYVSPLPWAQTDAKFRLAQAIFKQRQQLPPGPDELERLWIELGCRDTAHTCRVRWEIQSAGAAALDLVWQHFEGFAVRKEELVDILVSDSIGEVFVERNPRYVAGSDTPEQEEEKAARQRRCKRGFDLMRECAEDP